jgi:O-antigen/teichoic acid export membrane protein
MGSAILVARHVLPEDIGVWKSVALIQPYLGLLELGVLKGLTRQYALHQGAGEADLALQRAQVAGAHAVARSALNVLFVLVALGVARWRGSSTKTLVALALLTLPAFAGPLWSYYEVLYRSGRHFWVLGSIQVAETLYLVASVVLVHYADWVGLFVRSASVLPIGLVLRYASRPIRFRFRWDTSALWRLSRVGLKVVLGAYIYNLLMVGDNTLIAAMLGQEALGHYSIATTVQAAMVALPTSLNRIACSHMVFRFGKTGQASSLKRLAFLPVLYSAVLLPIPMVALWFAAEPLISWLLPQYTPGAQAARWMIVTGYFMCLRSSATVFTTLNRMGEYTLLLAGALGLMYLLAWLGIRYSGTIESAAMAKAATMALLAVGVNLVAYGFVNKSEVDGCPEGSSSGS